jgi:DNA polymerase-3 subunit delta'
MRFDNFIGNNKIKEQLTFLQQSNRLPHAIVIEGEAGLGKVTLAREIVLNLFCKAEDKPCRACPQCSKVLKGYHPDVYEFIAENRANSFHVDDVRNIIDDVYMRPNEADYKAYILGNCQGMNANAQNALLKVLEEPPQYAIFLLTVTNKSALLPTVLSRSVVISVEGVDAKLGADYICKMDENIDETDAFNAITATNGNIGRAIESLGDGKLAKITTIASQICNALVSEREYDLLIACSPFEKNKDTLVSTMVMLKSIFRDALLFNSGANLISGQVETAKLLSSRLSNKKILALIQTCDNIRILAEKNGNNAILITKVCYELRRAQNR